MKSYLLLPSSLLLALFLSSCVSPQERTFEEYVDSALTKYAGGDLDGAIADWSKAITLKSDFAPAYYNRGNAERDKGSLDDAIADYGKVIALRPVYTKAYNNRGLAKEEKGDIDGAIVDFNQTIALEPTNGYRYNNRANARRHKGDFAGAIADYDKAITLNPYDALAYSNRGITKETNGAFDDAMADYEKAVSLSADKSTYPSFHRLLTSHRLHPHHPDDQTYKTAKAELAQAVGEWKDGWTKTVGLYLTGTLNEPDFLADAAHGNAKTAREQECEAFYYAGMIHFLANEPTAARGFFEKCLATNVTNFSEFDLARAELGRLPDPH